MKNHRQSYLDLRHSKVLSYAVPKMKHSSIEHLARLQDVF